MFRINRVCVPLTFDCNLHCRYCYRDRERLETVPDFTSEMVKFLKGLRPITTEAVVASGGEPLFHWDKVKELFSYVPKDVHKKIMSNCTLLTQEMVDYINDNDIELLASHDGPKTRFLRGVDILEDEKTASLVRQVKTLTVSCVVTKYNTDVWENYFDVVKKLKRVDFQYFANAMNDVVPEQHYLVEGFDYGQWFTTYRQFCVSPFSRMYPWYEGMTLRRKRNGRKDDDSRTRSRYTGFNILPDGTVCGMIHVNDNYGSVDVNKYQECDEKGMASGLADYCVKSGCKYTDRCHYCLQHTSDHTCTCRRMMMDRWGSSEAEARLYVKEHLGDIVGKYFPEFAESGYLGGK